MNIDFVNAEHNYRINKATNEYRRANNPAGLPRVLKMVAATAKRLGVRSSVVGAQPAATDQTPTPSTSVQMLTR